MLFSIPSPARGAVHLGPVPLRGYALCIIVGVLVAIWLGDRRWLARGGRRGAVGDIAIWAVPFGLVGGRLYHVLTDYELYFTPGHRPIEALYVWNGGLGIWGAIALGGVGAWIGARRRGIKLPALADALAPGIVLAQGIGRWGNWFNQELYGRPSNLPWAVRIDPDHRPVATPNQATYQPTFLYESLWDIGVAGLVIWADRRFKLGHGRAFALYAALYTAGRSVVEYLRIDPAHRFYGLRLNDWTSLAVFVGAVLYFLISAKLRPGRDTELYRGDAATPPPALEAAAAPELANVPDQRETDAEAAKPATARPQGEPAKRAAPPPDGEGEPAASGQADGKNSG